MCKTFYLMLLIAFAFSGYYQISNAAPTKDDGSQAIEPNVDFEPDSISCDHYEQFVELPKELEITFKNRTESKYGMGYTTQQERSTNP